MSEPIWDAGFLNDQKFKSSQPYGKPLTGAQAAEKFGESRGDIPVPVFIFRDAKRKIKPLRGFPEVTAENFFKSLVQAPDGRWFFSGVLNDWAGFQLLELASIEETTAETARNFKEKNYIWTSKDAEKSSPLDIHQADGSPVKLPKINKKKNMLSRAASFVMGQKEEPEKFSTMLRAFLFLPEYTIKGFTKGSPGYAWYFAGADENNEKHQFSHGTNIIAAATDHDMRHHGKPSVATIVHHFGHRYAKLNETARDKLSYHSGVFIEWDHGAYGTIVELAWRNGIGGYRGQANWVHDKHAEAGSILYQNMPAETHIPWIIYKSEIRCYDVPMKNATEFLKYMETFTGPEHRFIDPKIKESRPVALVKRTKADLFEYILNRIIFDDTYDEPSLRTQSPGHNCQSFSGLFYGFLTNTPARLFSFPGSVESRKEMFAVDHRTGEKIKIEYEAVEAAAPSKSMTIKSTLKAVASTLRRSKKREEDVLPVMNDSA